MLPTLRSRAAWSFNKVEEVSDKLEGIKDRMEEEVRNHQPKLLIYFSSWIFIFNKWKIL